MGIIFLFSFDGIDIYCRRVMSATLSLPTMAQSIFLIVLRFFTGLVLVDRRLLEVLFTKYINIGKVSRLILLRVFVPFFGWPIPLETFGINLPDA